MSTTLSAGTSTTGAALASDTSGVLAFQTGSTPTTNMTLNNSGQLLVGETTSFNGTGTLLEVSNNINNNQVFGVQNTSSGTGAYGMIVYYKNYAPNNAGNDFIVCQDNSAIRARFYSNGGIGNFSANNVNLSDETVKKNITPAKNYLSILNQIPVVTFLLNDQTDDELNLGVTAQSVKAVAPELVGTMDIGTKETPNVKLAIYETDLKYAMLKAIQELSAQVTALQAEVTALKGAK